ncbi:TIGR02678 family protein [Paraburkholderia bannensis]|uniref:TIGR02678 family protein n=1 Tax=Paraburkholderia bannensis TaxID=765414 RepID=UPI002ABDB672|nr:TIGR02678 family protein [Paraburkholderia bannensis]
MNRVRDPRRDSQRIGDLQRAQQHEEFQRALRALLMTPLMSRAHEDFRAVRRQADRLREWFGRETGWPLYVERTGARLFKRPGRLDDDTRGQPNYDRRRYVLLSLACAVLERADPQITLKLIGERLVEMASDPVLAISGFEFTLSTATDRRDVVTVCRTLLEYGVLQRVAGDEESYVNTTGNVHADALYDVQRNMLAGMLAAVRGPSTWRTEDAPVDFVSRLNSLVAEHVHDSDQGRRDAIRHHLTRRLLDDPVIYTSSLDADHLAYFANQRGAIAIRLCEATGLVAEQRAEGLALTDEAGELTDISMPAEGTDSHVTLLVAEFLARRPKDVPSVPAVADEAVAAWLRDVTDQYGKLWRKSARVAGAEVELAQIALARLEKLQLIERVNGESRPLPAIARFALRDPEVASVSNPLPIQPSLFST